MNQQQQPMRRSSSRQQLSEQQTAAAAGTAAQPARVAAVRIKTEGQSSAPPPPPALAAPPMPHPLRDAAAAAAERRRSSGRGRPSCFFPPPERRRDSLEPASTALYIVRGKRCTVLDGCLQDSDPADCLTICVRSFTGLEVRRSGLWDGCMQPMVAGLPCTVLPIAASPRWRSLCRLHSLAALMHPPPCSWLLCAPALHALANNQPAYSCCAPRCSAGFTAAPRCAAAPSSRCFAPGWASAWARSSSCCEGSACLVHPRLPASRWVAP